MQTNSKSIAVSTFADAAERDGAMQAQLRDLLDRVDQVAAVSNATRVLDECRDRSSNLKKSQVRLMRRMQDLGRDLSDAARSAEDSVIEEGEPDLSRLTQLEVEHRIVSRAHQRLVERLLPEVEIAELTAIAAQLAARAKAVRLEAETRIARTAKLMAEAAEFEGHIAFDPANTLSGALFAHAAELETQCDNHRRWASERTEKHELRLREIESIQLLRG